MGDTMRDRTCRGCGAVFLGGPRAWYCPSCRAERARTRCKNYRRGVARPLGTTDLCQICGKPYVVIGGLQRYCKDCAETAIREKDRQQGMAYYLKHREKIMEQKKEKHKLCPERSNKTAVCPICGKSFTVSYHYRVYCSDECRAIQKKKFEKERKRPKRTKRQ